jgi:TonB family protein
MLFLVLSYGRLAAQQNPDSKRVQNIPSDEMWKRVKECVFPTYPGLAFNAHIKGTVDIGLGISPEGDVANYRVLSGHPLLVQSAVDAVRQWKFQPNVVQGELTWSRVRALARFDADGTNCRRLGPRNSSGQFWRPRHATVIGIRIAETGDRTSM